MLRQRVSKPHNHIITTSRLNTDTTTAMSQSLYNVCHATQSLKVSTTTSMRQIESQSLYNVFHATKRVSKSIQQLPCDKKCLNVYTIISMRQLESQSLCSDFHATNSVFTAIVIDKEIVIDKGESQSLYNDCRAIKRVSKAIQYNDFHVTNSLKVSTTTAIDKESLKVYTTTAMRQKSFKVYATTSMGQKASLSLYSNFHATNNISKSLLRLPWTQRVSQSIQRLPSTRGVSKSIIQRQPCDKESVKVYTTTSMRQRK